MRRYRSVRLLVIILRPLPHAKDWVELVLAVIAVAGVPAALGFLTKDLRWGLLALAAVLLLFTFSAAYRLLSRLEPKLTLECVAERDHIQGRLSRALLVVNNQGEDQVRNAYARIVDVVEHSVMFINGERRSHQRQLFEHREVYLRWQATGERTHTFHKQAILEVASGRNGDGVYGLQLTDPRWTEALHPGEIYDVTIEIASDGMAAYRESFTLRMDTPVHTNTKGETVIYIDLPFEVEFQAATKS